MALNQYKSGNQVIYWKLIEAAPKGVQMPIGIAFRTMDGPIGYLPFYGANDFDFNGTTSFKEEVMARLPINLSAAGSPHTLLLKKAWEDVEFLGAGDGDMVDIQQQVKRDVVQHAMHCAAGVFIDGIMVSLGGPTVKTLVGQLLKSKARQFIVSKAMSAAIKQQLKAQADFDTDRILKGKP